MPRFFVELDQIIENQIQITGQDVKHIRDVLRLTIGSHLTVCDGKGMDYKSKISNISDKTVDLDIIEKMPSRTETSTKITLFQSLIKGNKFEWVIQKSIEIGVDEIIPVQARHSVSRLDNPKKIKSRLTRWRKIATSAAKQSGRGKIPNIKEPVSYSKAVDECANMDLAFIADESEKKASIKGYLCDFNGKNIGILIGPEGGFSQQEIEEAKEKGIRSITLGPRILRSETAGLVLTSNILYELGEME